LCGMPVRWTTLMFWPEKVSLEDFANQVRDAVNGWEITIKKLKTVEGKLFAEQWAESLLGFMEIEVGDPSERSEHERK
jgi:hypothetical protein